MCVPGLKLVIRQPSMDRDWYATCTECYGAPHNTSTGLLGSFQASNIGCGSGAAGVLNLLRDRALSNACTRSPFCRQPHKSRVNNHVSKALGRTSKFESGIIPFIGSSQLGMALAYSRLKVSMAWVVIYFACSFLPGNENKLIRSVTSFLPNNSRKPLRRKESAASLVSSQFDVTV